MCFEDVATCCKGLDAIYRVGSVMTRSMIIGCVVLEVEALIASVRAGSSDLIG